MIRRPCRCRDAGPPSGSGGPGSQVVVVRGDSRGSVARARTQLELVMTSALSGNRWVAVVDL